MWKQTNWCRTRKHNIATVDRILLHMKLMNKDRVSIIVQYDNRTQNTLVNETAEIKDY